MKHKKQLGGKRVIKNKNLYKKIALILSLNVEISGCLSNVDINVTTAAVVGLIAAIAN